MTKKIGFKKYLLDRKTDFDVLDFYKHFNFKDREEAEATLKGVLLSLERKKDRLVKKLIKAVKKDGYALLEKDEVNLYWNKRKAQYKALEAAYKQKELAATVAAEIDDEVISEVLSKKRKITEEKNNEKKKQRVNKDKEVKEVAARRYVLDYNEVNCTDLTKLPKHKIEKKKLTVEERLALSSIEIVNGAVPQYRLSNASYRLINNWRVALKNEDELFILNPPPTNLEEMIISNTLSSLFLNDVKSSRFGADTTYKYVPSEIDFIVKFGSILLQNIFCGIGDISIDWDTMSIAMKDTIAEIFKTTRPDIILVCKRGVEVGCGEIKPPGKVKELIDIDRARIAEICKRQLHVRMKAAKNKKEHVTFGLMLAGNMLELSRLQYVEGKYEYSFLKSVKLSGRDTYYEDIEIALEALLSFKDLISQSWKVEDGDLDNDWFDQNFCDLKPTVRFLST